MEITPGVIYRSASLRSHIGMLFLRCDDLMWMPQNTARERNSSQITPLFVNLWVHKLSEASAFYVWKPMGKKEEIQQHEARIMCIYIFVSYCFQTSHFCAAGEMKIRQRHFVVQAVKIVFLRSQKWDSPDTMPGYHFYFMSIAICMLHLWRTLLPVIVPSFVMSLLWPWLLWENDNGKKFPL